MSPTQKVGGNTLPNSRCVVSTVTSHLPSISASMSLMCHTNVIRKNYIASSFYHHQHDLIVCLNVYIATKRYC